MAIGIYFSPDRLTAELYAECIRKLEEHGAGKPPGRLYHACFGAPDKLSIFDVWDSQQSFDHFGRTLMPILAELGLDTAAPEVMPVHNVIPG